MEATMDTRLQDLARELLARVDELTARVAELEEWMAEIGDDLIERTARPMPVLEVA